MADPNQIEFRIPRKHLEMLRVMAASDSRIVDRFVTAVEAQDVAFVVTDSGTLEKSLRENQDISTSPLLEAVPVLFALARTAGVTRTSISTEEMLGAILKDVLDYDPESTLNEQQVDYLRTALLRLLDSRIIKLVAKLDTLRSSNERPLLQSRIFSDLRPIFEGDGEDSSISGATLYHKLKLTFYSNGEEHNTYFTLDETDLEKLGASITRALAKHRRLKQIDSFSEINRTGEQ